MLSLNCDGSASWCPIGMVTSVNSDDLSLAAVAIGGLQAEAEITRLQDSAKAAELDACVVKTP